MKRILATISILALSFSCAAPLRAQENPFEIVIGFPGFMINTAA